MQIFRIVVSLVQAALPLPVWTDKASVAAWLKDVNPLLVELIAAIINQKQQTGQAVLELPDGQEIVLSSAAPMAIPSEGEVREKLESVAPEKWGDGKILEMLMKFLPLLIQFLPFLLSPAPATDAE